MRFDRRFFLSGTAASLLSTMTGRPAAAQFSEVSVPCVEWLAIRIVMLGNGPSAQDRPKLGESFQLVQPTSFRLPHSLSTNLQREATIHVQSASGPDMRSFLIDPCADSPLLLEQMDRLRIEPNSLDGLVLSRGERKELDALRGFLSSTNRSLKKNIDVVVGAEPLPAGLKKIASPIALESENLMSAAATGRCRVLAEQSFVVDSAQSDPTPLRSDDVTSAEYRREPENAAAQLNSISTSFVLMEKGLVIIMSSNESAADCVRAVQAASEVCDVHAIIGMNIGVGCSPAKTQKILSELLEFGPAHILVSADTVGPDFNLVDAAISKKIVRCSPATRIVFR